MQTTDFVLASLTCGAFALGLVVTAGTLSPPAVALGAIGTVVFEIGATRHAVTVRSYWERPLVRFGSFGIALGIVVAGAITAPSSVLSAGIGALVTYLALLASTRVSAWV